MNFIYSMMIPGVSPVTCLFNAFQAPDKILSGAAQILENPISLEAISKVAFGVFALYSARSIVSDLYRGSDRAKIILAGVAGGLVGGSLGESGDYIGGMVAGGAIGTLLALKNRYYPKLSERERLVKKIKAVINKSV